MGGNAGRLKLALDTGEQLVVGVAEGAHAFALELSGDGVEVDAGVLRTAEGCLGRAYHEALTVSATLPWSAKARNVASGIVLITSGAISSST